MNIFLLWYKARGGRKKSPKDIDNIRRESGPKKREKTEQEKKTLPVN